MITHKEKKKIVDSIFTKEEVEDAARYANFSQSFKMLMWERGFSGEEKLEEVAMILFNKYVKKV